MPSEFQRKMQEAKDKAQEGLSEFQRKMLEKEQEKKRTKINQSYFRLNLNAPSTRLVTAQQRINFR